MSTIANWFKNLPAERKAFCVFGLLAVIAMLAAWYDRSGSNNRPSASMQQAPPIAGTALPKQDSPLKGGGSVKTLPKKKVADKVPLPPEVLDDEDTEVTATAELPPSENGTKVISTINLNTGETKIYSKENDPSLFAFENKRRIGVGYGVSTEGHTAKVFGEWTFLRVGSFHLGAQAEIAAATTKSPEARAYAVIDYRF